MAGFWTHRDADIHRCDFPKYDQSIKTGDRWQCSDCDQEWIVEVKHHHDPRPGESYSTLGWQKYPILGTKIPNSQWRDR